MRAAVVETNSRFVERLASIPAFVRNTLRPRKTGEHSLGTWLLLSGTYALFAWAVAPAAPLVWLPAPFLVIAAALPAFREVLASLAREVPTRFRAAAEMSGVSLFYLGLTYRVFGRVLRDDVPIDTGDHAIMMVRAEAVTSALQGGEWRHWTHAMQGGESLTDLYPAFANILTVLFHAAMPEGTPFVRTYGLVVLFVWWLRGVGAYYLARRFGGPLVASVISLSAVFDVGSDVMSGVWNGAIYWGMIHSTLALSIGLFAVALQVDVMRGGSSRRLVACALLVGLLAFAHPLGIILAGLSTAAIGIATLVSTARRREGVWAFGASALGLLLAAFWILPFSHGHATLGYNNGLPGQDYMGLGRGLLSGSAPNTSFSGFTGFALVAVVAAVTSRRAVLVATGLTASFAWALVLSPLMVEARIFSLVPSLLDGQQERLLTVLKTASIPALTWLLGLPLRRSSTIRSLGTLRVLTRALLLGLLWLGPGRAITAGFESFRGDLQKLLPDHSPSREYVPSHTGEDHRKVFEWIRQRRAKEPSPTPFRVAILWRQRWRHAAWGEGFRTGVPVVDPNNVSSNFLGIRPREASEAGFHDWNIRYAITDHTERPFEGLVERFREGNLTVWELSTYDDRFVVAKEGVEIQGLRFEGDTIRFEVRGAPADGADLVVRTAWYPRWRALHGATSVKAVLPRPDAKPRQEQVLVRAGNGEVVLRCDGWLPRSGIGSCVSVLGVLGLVGVAARSRRERVERAFRRMLDFIAARARAHLRRASVAARGRALPIAAVVALMVLAIAIRARGTTELLIPPNGGPGLDVWLVQSGTRWRCSKDYFNGTVRCPDGEARVKSALGATGPGDDSGEMHRMWPGIRVDVDSAQGTVDLDFSRVRFAGSDLILETTSSHEFTIEPSISGVTLPGQVVSGQATARFTLPTGGHAAGPLTLRLRATSGGSHIVLRRKAPR